MNLKKIYYFFKQCRW